jgi:hypothetical protein
MCTILHELIPYFALAYYPNSNRRNTVKTMKNKDLLEILFCKKPISLAYRNNALPAAFPTIVTRFRQCRLTGMTPEEVSRTAISKLMNPRK